MCDGDILLVVEDKDFIKLAQKNMENIVPLYYEMKKADAMPLDPEHINNGIMLAYKSGKIGIYSNNITKIWNYKKFDNEYIDIIKLLCAESNFSIDSAKTLYMPKRPEWFRRKMIKFQKENLPHFFIFNKDKPEEKVDILNTNNIMGYIEAKIPNKKLSLTTKVGKFDYHVLMNNPHFTDNEICENIEHDFRQIVKDVNFKYKNIDLKIAKVMIPQSVKEDLETKYPEIDIVDLVDTLVLRFYNTGAKTCISLIWDIYGEILYNNIKKNTEIMSPYNKILGSRSGKFFY